MKLALILAAATALTGPGEPWGRLVTVGGRASVVQWTMRIVPGGSGDRLIIEKATWNGGTPEGAAAVSLADSATCPAIAAQIAKLQAVAKTPAPPPPPPLPLSADLAGAMELRIDSDRQFAGQGRITLSATDSGLPGWRSETDLALAPCWRSGGTRELTAAEIGLWQPPPRPLYTANNAVILAGPTLEQIAAVYPPTPRGVLMTGSAALSCGLPSADGRLQGCQVDSQNPTGSPWGVAALKLVALFKVAPSPGATRIFLQISLPPPR